MKRFFIDSSVFFAACYSERGRSRDLFTLAARGDVSLVVSQYVLDETREVIEEKAPQALPLLDILITAIPFDIVEPTHQQVIAASKLSALKDMEDAPILAAARKAKVDMLVSFDRKHLVGKPELETYIGAPIVLPQMAWELLQLP